MFRLSVSDAGSHHAGYGSPSLAAANNHNNPFSCPEGCWRMWLPCCVHQPAFSLVLISGFPLCYFVLCGEQNPPTPVQGKAPIKLRPGERRNDVTHKQPLGLVRGPSPCGCLPRTGGQWEKLSNYLKWIDWGFFPEPTGSSSRCYFARREFLRNARP